MALNSREKKVLLWGAPVLLILIWSVLARRTTVTPVATVGDTVPLAERKLAKLRQLAATVPGKEVLLKQVSLELAAREKGMIAADTAQQAQAQIQQIIRKLGSGLGIEVRGAEFGQVKPLGTDYGEAPVSVSFDCAIEQLVNLLASLGSQPEMLGTSEVRISSNNSKDKRINVRLTVAGVVAKKLIPEKKGIASF
jgi:hypothetical protein